MIKLKQDWIGVPICIFKTYLSERFSSRFPYIKEKRVCNENVMRERTSLSSDSFVLDKNSKAKNTVTSSSELPKTQSIVNGKHLSKLALRIIYQVALTYNLNHWTTFWRTPHPRKIADWIKQIQMARDVDSSGNIIGCPGLEFPL